MVIKLEKIKENPINLMRRAGYVFQRREGDEMSFVRILARAGYPRFHIYYRTEGECLVVNLHLDQKRETYGNSTRHHGEYDNSPAVENEAERLRNIFK
jgi:hypothetical protein